MVKNVRIAKNYGKVRAGGWTADTGWIEPAIFGEWAVSNQLVSAIATNLSQKNWILITWAVYGLLSAASKIEGKTRWILEIAAFFLRIGAIFPVFWKIAGC